MVDNKTVQFGLGLLAAFLILQMLNKKTTQENLDTVVTVSTDQNSPPSVSVNQIAGATTQVSVSETPNKTVIDVLPMQQTPPIITEPPLLSETIDQTAMQRAFAVEPTDPEQLFGKKNTMDPADLLPKAKEADLFANFVPNPKLDKNFLMNRWSYGIDVSKPKRGAVGDLRGAPPPPTVMSAVWNAPTQIMDLDRRTLADIC